MQEFATAWARAFSRPGMRGVGHRLTVSLVTLSICLMTLLQPDSLWHTTVRNSGQLGWAFVWVLTTLSLTALIDIFINDILPHEYVFESAAECRIYLFMSMASMHVAMLLAILKGYSWAWTMAPHVALAIGCTWVAIFDTMHRYVLPRYNLHLADE